jgi:hypothetical protein
MRDWLVQDIGFSPLQNWMWVAFGYVVITAVVTLSRR